MKNKTIVVNLLGGPGACKSILRAEVFAELKWNGVEVEEALEYAKDRVWEGSFNVLENQLYIFGKQQHRMFRVRGKVNVIVTDSSLLNSIIYDAKNDEDLRKVILNEFHKYDNVNIFLERDEASYNPVGRMQTLEQSKEIDNQIKDMLKQYDIPYITMPAKRESRYTISEYILKKLS